MYGVQNGTFSATRVPEDTENAPLEQFIEIDAYRFRETVQPAKF
jgi:hypothetical protein